MMKISVSLSGFNPEFKWVSCKRNMWLDDGNQRSFPVILRKTTTSLLQRHGWTKISNMKKSIRNMMIEKRKIYSHHWIVRSLNCYHLLTENLLLCPWRDFLRTSLMTCQKLYSSHYDRYGKQEIEQFEHFMRLKLLEQETCLAWKTICENGSKHWLTPLPIETEECPQSWTMQDLLCPKEGIKDSS